MPPSSGAKILLLGRQEAGSRGQGTGGGAWRIEKGLSGKARFGGFVDVAAPTPSICFALKVGTRGGAWVTTDRGATWTRHALPVDTKSYEAIDFTDAQTGWAVGAEGMIAKTTDGGLTWTPQVSGVAVRLHGVCFVDANVGYAVGEYGVIVVTLGRRNALDPAGVGLGPRSHRRRRQPDPQRRRLRERDEGLIVAAGGWTPGQANKLLIDQRRPDMDVRAVT